MNKQGLLWTLTLLLLITCTGCQSPESFSVSAWYDTLGQALNIFEESEPVENKIEQLISWNILNESYDMEDMLTYEVVIDTFERYLNQSLEVEYDRSSRVTKVNALNYIEQIINSANHKIFPREYDVVYQKPVYYIELYEENQNYFKCEDDLLIGDYLTFIKDGSYQIMEVELITPQGYLLKSIDDENLYQHFKISDTHDLDLSNATFEPSGANNSHKIEPFINTSLTSNSFEYQGYHISYSISGSGIRGYVSKQFNQHNYYSEFELNNLKTSYKWDYRDFGIKEAYFKLNYDSLFRVGVSRTKYFDKNFTMNILSKDLANSLKVIFNVDDKIEAIIPIGTIKIPLPATMVMDISLALELHVYASGKVELLIESEHALGLEIINNNVRLINDHKKDIDTIFRASANASIGIRGSLNAFGSSLVDVGAKAGVKGIMMQTLHLYDDHSHQSESIEIDAEALDTIEDSRFSICSDLSLHWFLSIYANSNRSLAGKLGLSFEKQFLSEDNQIFKNPFTHLEYWNFVPKCTKKDRLIVAPTTKPKQEQIELNSYQIKMSINDLVAAPIKNYPSDIKQSELILQCQNDTVCIVDGQNIKAVGQGQTILIIQDIAKKYEVRCQIIVGP